MFMYAVVQLGFWDTWAKQTQWPPLKKSQLCMYVTFVE